MGGMWWLVIALSVAACSSSGGGDDRGSSSSGGGIFGGGTGGSTSGGSTSGGSSGGGQCGPSTRSQACDQCIAKNCCDTAKACGSGSDCTALLDCLGSCSASDSACSDACLQRYPNGKAPLQNALACLDQSCTGVC